MRVSTSGIFESPSAKTKSLHLKAMHEIDNFQDDRNLLCANVLR